MNRERDIIQWAIDRNILGPQAVSTPNAQHRKTKEEVNELSDAIEACDVEEVKDAIGDIVVTLILQAQMWSVTVDECIEAAWQQIKDRKGKMVNGIFVKDAN